MGSLGKELENVKKLVEGLSAFDRLEKLALEQGRKTSDLEDRTASQQKLQEQMQKQVKDLEMKLNKILALLQKDGARRNDSMSKGGGLTAGGGISGVDEEKLKSIIEKM